MMAAILGLAVVPAVNSLAHAKKPDWLCSAGTPMCATPIIRVNAVGCVGPMRDGEERKCPPYPEETTALRIARPASGPRCSLQRPGCWGSVVGNWYTEQHQLRVASGHYGIAAIERASPTGRFIPRSKSAEVTVRAEEKLDVKLDLERI